MLKIPQIASNTEFQKCWALKDEKGLEDVLGSWFWLDGMHNKGMILGIEIIKVDHE